jgi:predicted esterase
LQWFDVCHRSSDVLAHAPAQRNQPDKFSLIAPRPLLVINSDSDNHTPLPGVIECTNAAQKVYAADHAADRFAVIIQKNTGHQVKPESERAAIDWFVKWLKP